VNLSRLAPWLVVLAVAAPLAAQDAAPKPRVAVLDFDYATVHSYVTDLFGNDVDIGKGIADMLVTNLVRDGHFSVIERKQLDKILQEQNFQQSGRADPSSAVKLARLLGVDAIIIGSITQFGRDDKKLGISGVGVHVGGIGLGGFGKKSAKAVVEIDARIVSTTTAEILGVATGHGESKRSGVSLAGGVESGGVGGAGALDMGSSNFGGTIIGEATRAAVDSLTGQVVGSASKITPAKVEIHALVADVSGSDIVVNVGTGAGIRVGAEYDVIRPGREIKDPATGRVLRRMTTPVGKLKITQADDQSASGTLSGGPAKVGDCVGACPTDTPAPPGPSVQPPAPASPAAASGPMAPLPALYSAPVSGAFTWGMYNFNGGEHYKYIVSQVEGGATKSGAYTIDAQKQGAQIMLSVNGTIGSDSYSSTSAIVPGQGIPMMQLAGWGPAAFVLFNPMFGFLFMGHQWQVGTGWSTSHNGETNSFKVESTCAYAGVQGLRGVLRKNEKVLADMCVSPNLGLPLAEQFNDENGSNAWTWTLTEFHP
jgi:curli biogenesis system outer membrane secretion channel CsgG